MATWAVTMFTPRGFSVPTNRNLPATWDPSDLGKFEALSIENMANYLSTYSATTYTPSRLANMTANDMRYACDLAMGRQA